MSYEISPEPSEAERAAIVAALAAEEDDRPALSPWVEAVLPEREPSPEPEP